MKVLVTGASGFVGARLLPLLVERHDVLAASRRELSVPEGAVLLRGELEDEKFLPGVTSFGPEVVVHLAALTGAERCEVDPEGARELNAGAPARMARALRSTCRRFLYVSTDLVFDGERGGYRESDAPRPLSVYGASKLAGEESIREAMGPRATVVRLALCYGARWDPASRQSFIERAIRSAAEGSKVTLFTDELRTPIDVVDAARSLARLVEVSEAAPLLHLGGPERCTRYDMGIQALETFGLPRSLARPASRNDSPGLAPRPEDVSLDSSLAASLGLSARSVREGLDVMKAEMASRGFMVGS